MIMVQAPPKPKAAPSSPKPKPKPVPSSFVRKVVTLIRESGYDYDLNVLTHERKDVIIKCHPFASRYKIEGKVYKDPMNADWTIDGITNPILVEYDNGLQN